MQAFIDLQKRIKDKIDSGEAPWLNIKDRGLRFWYLFESDSRNKKDGSPAKKKKKRAMNKGEYRDKDGKICKTSKSDEDAGYPPNCNEGYKEEDGKCVPIEKGKKENKLRPGKEDGNQNCPNCY